MSPDGRAWLVGLEGGVRLRAYRDSAGIPTIGVGQTYFLNGGRRKRVEMGDSFATKGAALESFDKVLAEFEAAVDAATRDDITQAEFDSFVAFAFNIGIQGFNRSTALRRFNDGAGAASIADAMRMWNKADGKISVGLMERRDCEAEAFLFAKYRFQGDRLERRIA